MSDSLKVTWGPGLQDLLTKLKNRPEAMKQAVAPALYMEGEETIADAKPVTPVLHGFLVNSGHVNLPEISEDSISVEFGFGGVAGSGNQGGSTNEEDVGYAVFVHENLTAHHDVGGAKFLENPLNARLASMSDRLAGRIQERLPD